MIEKSKIQANVRDGIILYKVISGNTFLSR